MSWESPAPSVPHPVCKRTQLLQKDHSHPRHRCGHGMCPVGHTEPQDMVPQGVIKYTPPARPLRRPQPQRAERWMMSQSGSASFSLEPTLSPAQETIQGKQERGCWLHSDHRVPGAWGSPTIPVLLAHSPLSAQEGKAARSPGNWQAWMFLE